MISALLPTTLATVCKPPGIGGGDPARFALLLGADLLPPGTADRQPAAADGGPSPERNDAGPSLGAERGDASPRLSAAWAAPVTATPEADQPLPPGRAELLDEPAPVPATPLPGFAYTAEKPAPIERGNPLPRAIAGPAAPPTGVIPAAGKPRAAVPPASAPVAVPVGVDPPTAIPRAMRPPLVAKRPDPTADPAPVAPESPIRAVPDPGQPVVAGSPDTSVARVSPAPVPSAIVAVRATRDVESRTGGPGADPIPPVSRPLAQPEAPTPTPVAVAVAVADQVRVPETSPAVPPPTALPEPTARVDLRPDPVGGGSGTAPEVASVGPAFDARPLSGAGPLPADVPEAATPIDDEAQLGARGSDMARPLPQAAVALAVRPSFRGERPLAGMRERSARIADGTEPAERVSEMARPLPQAVAALETRPPLRGEPLPATMPEAATRIDDEAEPGGRVSEAARAIPRAGEALDARPSFRAEPLPATMPEVATRIDDEAELGGRVSEAARAISPVGVAFEAQAAFRAEPPSANMREPSARIDDPTEPARRDPEVARAIRSVEAPIDRPPLLRAEVPDDQRAGGTPRQPLAPPTARGVSRNVAAEDVAPALVVPRAPMSTPTVAAAGPEPIVRERRPAPTVVDAAGSAAPAPVPDDGVVPRAPERADAPLGLPSTPRPDQVAPIVVGSPAGPITPSFVPPTGVPVPTAAPGKPIQIPTADRLASTMAVVAPPPIVRPAVLDPVSVASEAPSPLPREQAMPRERPVEGGPSLAGPVSASPPVTTTAPPPGVRQFFDKLPAMAANATVPAVPAVPENVRLPNRPVRGVGIIAAEATAPRFVAPIARPVLSGPAAQVFAADLRRGARDARVSADAGTALLGPTLEAAVGRIDSAAAPLDLRQDRWPSAMIERIERLRDDANAADTRIRLVPDALGEIGLSVSREGETVSVRFTAEQAATRALLQDVAPRLAEAAEARGVKLGQTSVDGGAGTGGGGSDPQRAPPAPLPAAPASARAAIADEDPTDTRIA